MTLLILPPRYKPSFADNLARVVRSLCPTIDSTPHDKPFTIAFICSPTAFVALSYLYSDPSKSSNIELRLLEYDQRFAVLARGDYVSYDLNEPDRIPQSLLQSVHLAIVDPPYLNETTNSELSHTLSLILHLAKGKFLLITSTSIEDILRNIYAEPPLGPLYLTQLGVEHGRLANDFACWGSWSGARELQDHLETKEFESA
ncbi:hypothetical protein AX15_002440 [Amanita polypyramis BW_CC]|nr:hypothetical protein AX15_002440 [Amanita polypyramis BW_CC]